MRGGPAVHSMCRAPRTVANARGIEPYKPLHGKRITAESGKGVLFGVGALDVDTLASVNTNVLPFVNSLLWPSGRAKTGAIDWVDPSLYNLFRENVTRFAPLKCWSRPARPWPGGC